MPRSTKKEGYSSRSARRREPLLNSMRRRPGQSWPGRRAAQWVPPVFIAGVAVLTIGAAYRLDGDTGVSVLLGDHVLTSPDSGELRRAVA